MSLLRLTPLVVGVLLVLAENAKQPFEYMSLH